MYEKTVEYIDEAIKTLNENDGFYEQLIEIQSVMLKYDEIWTEHKKNLNESKFFVKCLAKEIEEMNQMEEQNAISNKQNQN